MLCSKVVAGYLRASLDEEAALVVVGVGLEPQGRGGRAHPAPNDAVYVDQHQQRKQNLMCGMHNIDCAVSCGVVSDERGGKAYVSVELEITLGR